MALDSLKAPIKEVPKPANNSNWVSLPTVNIQPNGAPVLPTLGHRASEVSLGSTVAGSQHKPFDSSSTIDKLEKQEPIWAGYQEDEPVPQTNGWLIRNLRHQAFSIYRRLFSLVFLINVGVFAWVMAEKRYDAHRLGGIVVANVFIGVLMRQEIVINTAFAVCTAIPSSYV